MFYIVFEVKELFMSQKPDAWLRWDLDQNAAFKMDKWFILKNQNWKLQTCDSFPLIVSHLCIDEMFLMKCLKYSVVVVVVFYLFFREGQ